jgi:hypothetical protein
MPYGSIPAAFVISTFWIIQPEFAGDFSNPTAQYAVRITRSIFGGVLLVFWCRYLVFWSSTLYASVFRNRNLLPTVLGCQLLIWSITRNNPNLKLPFSDNILSGNAFFRKELLPIMGTTFLALLLQLGLFYLRLYFSGPSLPGMYSPHNKLMEFYLDDRFETGIEWTRLGREYFAGERERLDDVEVKVKSVCNRPLEGEWTRDTFFWFKNRGEMWSLTLAVRFLFMKVPWNDGMAR